MTEERSIIEVRVYSYSPFSFSMWNLVEVPRFSIASSSQPLTARQTVSLILRGNNNAGFVFNVFAKNIN